MLRADAVGDVLQQTWSALERLNYHGESATNLYHILQRYRQDTLVFHSFGNGQVKTDATGLAAQPAETDLEQDIRVEIHGFRVVHE